MKCEVVRSVVSRGRKLATATLILVTVFLAALFVNPCNAQVSEATQQNIVETFTDYFNDVPIYRTMTTDQKIQYILTQGKMRIIGRVLGMARSNLATYSEEVLRRKWMIKYIDEYAAQKVFMTTMLEGRQAGESMKAALLLEGYEKTRDQVKVLNIGAALGAGAIMGYLDKGLEGAFWGTTQAAGEAYLESAIPYYGWVKLVVQIEVALINYFIGYVKEQQTRCALNHLYGKALIRELASMTKAQVEKDFESRWVRDDGLADIACGRYGFQAEGLRDPKTGEVKPFFKDDVKTALLNMKDNLDQRIREAEAQTKAILSDEKRKAEAQFKEAEEKLKAEYEKVITPVKPLLGKIDELKKTVPEVAKTKARETKGKLEQAQGQIASQGDIPYTPLDRNKILNALSTALSEIRDGSGGGYNRDTYNKLDEQYRKVWSDTIRATQRKISDDVSACIRNYNERYRDVPSNKRPSGCTNSGALWARLENEKAILAEEQKLLDIEARERGMKMADRLRELATKTAMQIREINTAYGFRESAFREELKERFGDHLSRVWIDGWAVDPVYAAGFAWGPTGDDLRGRFRPAKPGLVAEAYDMAEARKEQLLQLEPIIPEFQAREKKIYSDYETSIILLRNQLQAAVPANMLTVPTESWEWSIHCGSFCQYVEIKEQLPRLTMSLDMVKRPLARMEKPLVDLTGTIKYVRDYLDVLRPDATVDALALTINKAAPTLVAALGDYRYTKKDRQALRLSDIGPDRFTRKNGVYSAEITPDQSDGAAYLAAMKAAWEKYRGMLEKFQNWKKVYGRGLKYLSDDPAPFLAGLTEYEQIPEKIRAAEQNMAAAFAERKRLEQVVDTELQYWRDRLGKFTDPERQLWDATRNAVPEVNQKLLLADRGVPEYVLGKQKLLAYKKDLEVFIADKEKEVAAIEEGKRKAAEEQRKKQAQQPAPDPGPQKASPAVTAATHQAPKPAPVQQPSSSPSVQTSPAPPQAGPSASYPGLPGGLPYPYPAQVPPGSTGPIFTQQPAQTVQPQTTARSTPSVPVEEATRRIKETYAQLTRALEAQEVNGVIQCVGAQWLGTEGIAYPTLRTKLQQAFQDASEIKCTIQNLKAEHIADERYKVTYDITLTSTLEKTKEARQEQLRVTDEVTLGKTGTPQITRTLQGRFWPK
jgi:hypothetical protein